MNSSSKKSSSIWLEILGKNQRDFINAQQTAVVQILEEEYPAIATAKPNQRLDQDSAVQLIKKLSEKISTAGYIQRCTFLARILEYGRNNLDWDVYIPSLPATIKQPANRFRCNANPINGTNGIALVNSVATALIADLSSPPADTMLASYGQLLLSAIMFGALVAPEKQRLFFAAIHPIHQLQQPMPGELYVTLSLSDSDDNKQIWHCDPITKGLLLRWQRLYAGADNDSIDILTCNPDRAISAYLNHLDISIDCSIAALRQYSVDRLSLRLAPYLIDYAKGINRSVSLPYSCWMRLLSEKALKIDDQHTPLDDEFVCNIETFNTDNLSAEYKHQQYHLWKRCQKKISKPNITHASFHKLVDSFLRKNGDKLLPALTLIALWGMELVTYIDKAELAAYPHREKSKLRPGSALRYMGDIARYLLTAATEENLCEMDSDELHDLYADTIALCPRAKKVSKRRIQAPIELRCAEALQRFHGFLQYRYGVAEVDFSDLVATNKTKIKVDANLISYTEYHRMQQIIAPNYHSATRLPQMQSLVLMLGFLCGLRRGECLRLRLCDVHVVGNPVLLIRNSRYGRTKSLSSVRQLPIGALLDAKSLDQLLDWHAKRCHEAGNDHQALMFCDDNDNRRSSLQHHLFAPIRSALHQITGDTTLRYHHLRHSFANWTLVKLVRHTISNACEQTKAPFLADDVFSAENCNNFRHQLLANGCEGRKALYELARLLGHESSDVTLLHYVHILDWLLAKSLSEPDDCQPSVAVTSISNLINLSSDHIYYLRKKMPGKIDTEHWYLSDFLPLIKPLSISSNSIEMVEADLTPLPCCRNTAQTDFANLQRIIPRVLSALTTGDSTQRLAKILEIDQATFDRWQRNANWIRGLQTNRAVPRHCNVAAVQRGVTRFPLPVKTAQEKDLQKRIFSAVAKMDSDQQSKLKKFLRYFLLNYSISAMGIQFKDDDLLALYIARLRNLGIYRHEICVNAWYRNANQNQLYNEEKRLKSVCRDAVTISAVAYTASRAKKYHFAIKVIDTQDKRTDTTSGVYYANYGFRSAMYLLAIAIFGDEDLHLVS